ncbi:unnamed protein product [Camellia sinensis]
MSRPSPPLLTSVAHRHRRKSPSPSVFLSHRGSDCWVFADVVVAGYSPKAYVCIRYRDFCTLDRRLKTLFTGQGWILPSTWSSVERVSKKIFGNVSPDVVTDRSALVQECLRSILHSRFSSSLPSALKGLVPMVKQVKVCDICGDAGREDFLATSSKCSDGAEHIYCMGVRMEKIPKGNWMCEDCLLQEEIEKQKQNKLEKVGRTPQGPSSNKNLQNAGNLNTNIRTCVELDAKGSDVEKSRRDKVSSISRICAKRPAGNLEFDSITKRRALETSVGSPRMSNPCKKSPLSQGSLHKNVDNVKVKPTCHVSTFSDRSPSSMISFSNSPKTRTSHLELFYVSKSGIVESLLSWADSGIVVKHISCGEFFGQSPDKDSDICGLHEINDPPNKREEGLKLQQGHLEGSTIIYVPTRKETLSISKFLCKCGVKAAAYNAKHMRRKGCRLMLKGRRKQTSQLFEFHWRMRYPLLKSEILSLHQRGGSLAQDVDGEVILLRTRLSEMETEIKRFEELVKKERMETDSERRKADAERKEANEARKIVKAEKNRAAEERRLVDTERKKVEENRIQLEKLKSEADEARSKLVLEAFQSEEANKKIQAEKQKVIKEKKRADSKRAKAEELRELVEINQKKHRQGIERLRKEIDELVSLRKLVEALDDLSDKCMNDETAKVKGGFPAGKSSAAEERRLVDIERKKVEENLIQLEKLKREADDARSKLVLETFKSEEANKKIEAEKKKVITEKKRADSEMAKAEELRKFAKINQKKVMDEKCRADYLSQQVEEHRQRIERLQRDIDELVPLRKFVEAPDKCMNAEAAEVKGGLRTEMLVGFGVLKKH